MIQQNGIVFIFVIFNNNFTFLFKFQCYSKDYQPGWTLVGAGLKTADQVRSPQKDCIPKGVDWIKSSVVSFDPDNRTVTTSDGHKINYDYLIVASGIEINFDGVYFLII